MKTRTRVTRRQFISQTVCATAGVAVWTQGAAATAKEEANPFAYDVERFTKTDPKLVQYEEAGRFACPHAEPRRICFDGEDRLHVAGGVYVSVLNAQGEPVREIELGDKARCVACAGDGTIYAGVREHVEVFDSGGRRLATWETPGKKTWFTGMAVSEQALFVADAGNRVVLRYERSGKLAGRIGEKNKDRNVPGLIVPSPYLDVALGKDGLLRVNNPGRHRVELYTPEGDLELTWGKPGAGIQSFCGCCNPVAVAMLPDGRCITCEKGLPRVKVHTAEGAFEGVVCGPESFPKNAQAGAARDSSDGTMGGLDAAVDSKGRIYVLDIVTAEVRVMSRKAQS